MELSASVEYVRMIMHYVQEFGLDPEQIYREAGFDPLFLEDPETRITADQFMSIWRALEKNSSDPNVGLHLGECVSKFPLHIVHMLVLNAPTIGDAIDKLSQYFNLLASFHTPVLSKTKYHASLMICYHSDEYEISRHSNETILSAYASLLYRISEDKIQFNRVYFAHPRPEDISEHQRIFNASIFFDQPDNKIVFENKYLSFPVVLSDQNVLETLEKLASKLQDKIFNYRPWSKKISQCIIESLNTRDVDLETAARKLSITPRKLQEHLKKENVTYKKLLDDIRKEQAFYLLNNENFPISEIALHLGYADQSVFSRAFKRWAGSTPHAYRALIK